MSHPAMPADTASVRLGRPDGHGGVERDDVAPTTGVAAAIGRLGDAVEALDNGLGILDARLTTVLGSGTPHPTAGADPRPPVGDSTLVEVITDLAARVEGARQHIDGLLNRLEL